MLRPKGALYCTTVLLLALSPIIAMPVGTRIPSTSSTFLPPLTKNFVVPVPKLKVTPPLIRSPSQHDIEWKAAKAKINSQFEDTAVKVLASGIKVNLKLPPAPRPSDPHHHNNGEAYAKLVDASREEKIINLAKSIKKEMQSWETKHILRNDGRRIEATKIHSTQAMNIEGWAERAKEIEIYQGQGRYNQAKSMEKSLQDRIHHDVINIEYLKGLKRQRMPNKKSTPPSATDIQHYWAKWETKAKNAAPLLAQTRLKVAESSLVDKFNTPSSWSVSSSWSSLLPSKVDQVPATNHADYKAKVREHFPKGNERV